MRWRRYLALAILGAAMVFGADPARPAAAQSGVPARDLATYGDIGALKTDGRLAAWSVYATDLVVADLASGQTKTLDTQQYGFTDNYDVSGGRVAWTHGGELRIYDSASGATSAMPLPETFRLFDLHGDLLVWAFQSGAPPELTVNVWARNIATMAPAWQVASNTGTIYGVNAVATNGASVIWAQGFGTTRYLVCNELYAAPLDGSAPARRLADGSCGINVAGFALRDDTLFYVGEPGILYQHPLNGSPVAITDASFLGSDLRISGNYLVGKEYREARDGGPTLVDWIYDLENKSSWPVASYVTSNGYYTSIDIGGATVVWSDHSGPQPVVRVRPIGAVTPAAPRAAGDPLLQGRAYYGESQHSLGGRFGQYWGRNGGLAVFGYPLTEEFRQLNPDTGITYEVQYLERQRYEYHPELAGTPYEVLLGRLGAELLELAGRDWRAEGDDRPGAQQLPGECQAF
ncbi:MAG TPA: hypothetical protein VD886_12295, partial [Herpetosiphonaceae bacterium]|nr:hypothetical protein [Herpetosiphonaceae bacterium]